MRYPKCQSEKKVKKWNSFKKQHQNKCKNRGTNLYHILLKKEKKRRFELFIYPIIQHFSQFPPHLPHHFRLPRCEVAVDDMFAGFLYEPEVKMQVVQTANH